jgi:hypothetical protein
LHPPFPICMFLTIARIHVWQRAPRQRRSRPPSRDSQITGGRGAAARHDRPKGPAVGVSSRLSGQSAECTRLIHAAVDIGITFMDNAEAHDGRASAWAALAGRRDEVSSCQSVHRTARTSPCANPRLLCRLKTDHPICGARGGVLRVERTF